MMHKNTSLSKSRSKSMKVNSVSDKREKLFVSLAWKQFIYLPTVEGFEQLIVLTIESEEQCLLLRKGILLPVA